MINGNPISIQEMLDLVERVGAHENDKPTWFELMTALAFQYFKEQQVDLGVIEVGLGGTYDATNVLQPEISVLTNVGLDHTEILGNTVEEIAADKVGIIKAGRRVVSGVTQPSVIEIVEQQSRDARAPSSTESSTISWKPWANGASRKSPVAPAPRWMRDGATLCPSA